METAPARCTVNALDTTLSAYNNNLLGAQLLSLKRINCTGIVDEWQRPLGNAGGEWQSRLWLIDLAGSERVGRTEADGDRLREAQFINRSLSALGDCIHALATHAQHVPFRNSKLTYLLQV